MLNKITPANLIWGEDNLPRSVEFGDLYFSAENGLAETRHVFLDGNNLRTRWEILKPGDLFVIAETGFGTGLNLLAAAKLWQEVASPKSRLQIVSIERYPLRRDDLARALSLWSELTELASCLLENYPPLAPGYHRFDLLPNVQVTLVFDDIESGLRSLCPPLEPKLWDTKPYSVDAWFLDGFAPAKNPQMWQQTLFPLMHRLGKPGTTAATFTAAGDVRRAMQTWGFEVTKVAGFGRKREMLVARYDPNDKPDLNLLNTSFKKPAACWVLPDPPITKTRASVAILGAGIAGATLASALAGRGIEVDVFDAAESHASGASGISQVALYARLSPDQGDLEDFMLSAMNFSQRYYQKLLSGTESGNTGKLCGLIQLPRNDNELKKMEQVSERLADCSELVQFSDPAQLSKHAGMQIGSPGLFFPNSGWLNGAEVASELLRSPGINLHFKHRLESLSNATGRWQLEFHGHPARSYEILVLCAANQSKDIEQLSWLPTRPIRGQVSLFQSPGALENLKTVICREIQLTPGLQNLFCTGSTYGLDETGVEVNAEDHQKNLGKLQAMLGSKFSFDLKIEDCKGQAALRCSTPDYLPIVGPVPNYERLLERYSALRKDARSQLPFPAPAEPGLFANTGYGSRGFTYAPICAEILASQICREMPPLPDYLLRAINPARFLIRGLIRRSL